MRQTSLLAYADLQKDPVKLGQKQIAVLRVIEQHYPITNRQIADRLGWAINTVTPRCLELREKQQVVVAKKDIDQGRIATFWKPTKTEREYENE